MPQTPSSIDPESHRDILESMTPKELHLEYQRTMGQAPSVESISSELIQRMLAKSQEPHEDHGG